jgi:N-acetyl sugar amidotransferase
MSEREFQICNRCVMDTTDPDITFDKNGICNHCYAYDEAIKNNTFSGEAGKNRLNLIIEAIKKRGKGKEYDCIIGLSGGVDSSYVAYKVKEFGLRPLAIHLDNGWDSELAVKNIEQIIKILNIELYTHVIDWEEFKNLQLAFLKASTPDSEVPSDHAIFAIMIRMAKKYKVPVITGMNTRTESHLPAAWSQGHIDWRYIKSINKKFGKIPLKTFPHFHSLIFSLYFRSSNWIHILNYLDYNKEETKKFLINELCWKDYGWKHHESIYTRFFQGYILPKKFGYDKRKTHLSSLICSGEISRENALEELKNEPYPIEMQEEDKSYLLKKFNLTIAEFEDIMNKPPKSYNDYPNCQFISNNIFYKLLRNIYNSIFVQD